MKSLFVICLFVFSACHFSDNVKPSKELGKTNQEPMSVKWKKEVLFTNQPSEHFSYELRFNREDSMVIYSVDSKSKDYYDPLYLNHLMIVSKEKSISIRFKYQKKISQDLSYDYKKLDFTNIDDIFITDKTKKEGQKDFEGTVKLSSTDEINSFLVKELHVYKQ
ncbi:hypothetical protein [Ferruginibacter sp. HRS2-29]|uniref:hypothetical protein n=1 Tax=Ferruginibacter sp. HRS2-29 TaxID=2487334 RepID=UPI0020CFC856|nr:hypothetical protein [Ferruginibacter sp. HRS2-29]